jgi:hypothetical protein
MPLERRDYEVRILVMQDMIDENEEKIKKHATEDGMCYCINCQTLREFNSVSSKILAKVKYEMKEKFDA